MNLKKQTPGEIVQGLFNAERDYDYETVNKLEDKLFKINGITLFINWDDIL